MNGMAGMSWSPLSRTILNTLYLSVIIETMWEYLEYPELSGGSPNLSSLEREDFVDRNQAWKRSRDSNENPLNEYRRRGLTTFARS